MAVGFIPRIKSISGLYEFEEFANEKDLEKAVVDHSDAIFGDRAIYFDLKRKVRSKKGDLGSIPDGYLVSLAGAFPKLFIIENEIPEYDELDIGQQSMRYQATFKEGQYQTKMIL